VPDSFENGGRYTELGAKQLFQTKTAESDVGHSYDAAPERLESRVASHFASISDVQIPSIRNCGMNLIMWHAEDVPPRPPLSLPLPPDTEAGGGGNAIVKVLTETVAPEKLEETYSVLGQMEQANPTYEHWYLSWFGVGLASQANGLGSQLTQQCLDVVDRTHCHAYLETPNQPSPFTTVMVSKSPEQRSQGVVPQSR
jgi:hypothetical protein